MNATIEPRILVPLDSSTTAERAIEVAADLAGRIGGKLFFVEVIKYRPEAQFVGGELCRLEATQRHEDVLRALVEKHLGEGVSFSSQVLLHHSRSRGIVAHARRIGASYIVMGTHGRTGVSCTLSGSVTGDVMKLARCPVLTVGPAAETSMAMRGKVTEVTSSNTHPSTPPMAE